MQFMGATLRKITIKDGLMAALYAVALAGGLATALHSTGRDMHQALDVVIPVFIGSLASAAGVNPVRSPLLLVLIGVAAAGIMSGAGLAMRVLGA